jgi:predicted O-methyltransferase YrrM
MRYLSNLSTLHARWLLKVFSKPEMIPARLFAPRPCDPIEAAVYLIPRLSTEQARACLAEIPNDSSIPALNEASQAVRHRKFGYQPCFNLVYILIRHLRPQVMVETGVFDGHSTAVELMAFRRNGSGVLISIDLPATSVIAGSTQAMENTTLPRGCDPGWIIPAELRAQNRLLLGDAAVLLPAVLAEFPYIDIFMHDSLHTYDHMLFEYRAAWQKLRSGGFLLSDDVFWSAAFHQFARQQKRRYILVDYDFGVIRK